MECKSSKEPEERWIKVCIQPGFKSATNYKKTKQGWNNLWYFRDSKRSKAKIANLKDKSVSSVIKFRDNTFYKVQSLSIKDPIFDYYRKKKDGIDEDICDFGRAVIPRMKKIIEYEHPEFKYETKNVELEFN